MALQRNLDCLRPYFQHGRSITVRIEIYRLPGAPLPDIELVVQSAAIPGRFERRVDARYRAHGLELVMTVNDHEYYLHRIQTPEENDRT